MAISIPIEITRSFEVAADVEKVFSVLADVPASTAFFPKLEQLVSLGDNIYRWEMEKVGVDKHAVQTVYACRYLAEKDKRQVTWEPVAGVGNGEVSGSWQLSPAGAGTRLRFCTKAKLELPLPALLRLAISPVVKHEFNALVDTYVENLRQHFAVA